MSMKKKTKRGKRRDDNTSDDQNNLSKSNDPPKVRLNVDKRVDAVKDNVFPWTTVTPEEKADIHWPYVLQPPLKPQKFIPTYKFPSKKSQTELKWFPKRKTPRKSSIKESFMWNPPQEKVSLHSTLSSETSDSADKSQINLELLSKKIQLQTPVADCNKLPKYVTSKSSTLIPDWIKTKIPENIIPKTVIQAGKPWHKNDECTWASELKNLSTLPCSKTQDKSPKMDWGRSVCSFHKKIFDHEYRRKINRKSLPPKKLRISSLDKDLKGQRQSCLGSLRNMIKKKKFEPINISNEVEVRSAQSLTPTDSLVDQNSPSFSTRELVMLSYSQKHDKKKEHAQPDVSGIENSWSYLTQRKWPSNVIRTKFFRHLVSKSAPIQTIDKTKYPVYGQWPYIDNMIKTTNTITGSFKKSSKESDFNLSPSKERLMKLNVSSGNKFNKKTKMSSMSIATGSAFKTKTYVDEHFGYKTGVYNLNELEQTTEILPSTLNNQKFFPGFIESQPTSIKPLLAQAQFTYQLSNLHLFELKYTHLLRKEKYLRVLIYYSIFNNSSCHDPFQIIKTERYLNKLPYLDVPSTGPATIYYPTGTEAIQCSYSCVENQPPLLTRRYTIYNVLTHRIEAVFDSLGNGIVYDKKGKIILNYSQNFGVYFNNNKVLKWRWHNIPVTEEIFEALTDSFDNISNIPNTEMEEMRSRDINLYENYALTMNTKFSKLEPKNDNFSLGPNPIAYSSNGDINYGAVTPLKPFILKINDYIKLNVKDQKQIILKFQANEVKLAIQLGIILNPKIVLRTESIDYRLVPKQVIPCKFDKIVGDTKSLLDILEHVGNGKKLNAIKNDIQLIDFSNKVVNLIEEELSESNLEKSIDLIDPLSNYAIKVTNKEFEKIKVESMKQSRRRLINIRNQAAKLTPPLESLQKTSYHSGEKLLEDEISKIYYSANLLDGSNPIVSNLSLLLSNKLKLEHYLKAITR